MSKPLSIRPNLYAHYLPIMVPVARNLGYNLVAHGSMARDLDLIAIPWTDTPATEVELIRALAASIGVQIDIKDDHQFKVLPGGRKAGIIELNRGGYVRDIFGQICCNADGVPVHFTDDPQYYIDISITPLVRSVTETVPAANTEFSMQDIVDPKITIVPAATCQKECTTTDGIVSCGFKCQKPFWHELNHVDRFQIQNVSLVEDIVKNYRQPSWCMYPSALNGRLGCWALVGQTDKICHAFCQDCEMYIKPSQNE